MLDALDKKIIAAMQDEFPLVSDPYRVIAERLGISEDELLRRLERYRQTGQLRKMGAVLRHREVGYAANALCAWVVTPEREEEVGRLMAAHPAVTHCYSRLPAEEWPYNFYTMVHAHTRAECREIVEALARAAGLDQYTMLFSTREWKKTSMHYFREGEEQC
ncbi:AsnC family transcriptional regulator [Sporolituus thermophilus]|uniref:siroheme decarboxylase n=1 Tax=Sporolituus thermophilus DSM 23256 TaxID=1123285 RepID=A0A1G7J4J1_9FIRM|nr:AsnC family transcriptional regulator [Sporolituus thermophilus]SDF19803.1 transcriptional regulator, AsnC family [Sporolituus thermophilus DSM 23256]